MGCKTNLKNNAKPLRAGTFRPAPVYLRAGMTVEASLVLPIFIFFMAQLLYIFEMIRLQSRFLQAIHETGTQLAEYAFYTEYAVSDILSTAGGLIGTDAASELLEEVADLLGDADGIAAYGISFMLSETYVRSSVEDYLGTDYLDNTCLSGGASSISYLQSSIMTEGDIIDLVADYRLSPLMSYFGLEGFSVQTRYYGHAWTGYTIGSSDAAGGETEESGEIVYITETGTVYHRSSSCSYLKPSVRQISASEADSLRSSDGSRYYACEICNPVKTGTLFITSDGNRYHSSSSCSAIKRTVIEVPLSQVEGSMPGCSKCAS